MYINENWPLKISPKLGTTVEHFSRRWNSLFEFQFTYNNCDRLIFIEMENDPVNPESASEMRVHALHVPRK